MSTATVDVPVGTIPGGVRRRPGQTRHPQRRHLRLVGEQGISPAKTRPSRRALRLTRRGRLALTTTTTLVVALVVASVVGFLGPAGATSSVVVEPGMTLSQIAAEQRPDLPLDAAVTEIQQLNRLSTTSIVVGQELVIPGR